MSDLMQRLPAHRSIAAGLLAAALAATAGCSSSSGPALTLTLDGSGVAGQPLRVSVSENVQSTGFGSMGQQVYLCAAPQQDVSLSASVVQLNGMGQATFTVTDQTAEQILIAACTSQPDCQGLGSTTSSDGSRSAIPSTCVELSTTIQAATAPAIQMELSSQQPAVGSPVAISLQESTSGAPAAGQQLTLCATNSASVSPNVVQLDGNGEGTATITDQTAETVQLTACPLGTACSASAAAPCVTQPITFQAQPSGTAVTLSLSSASALVGGSVTATVQGFSPVGSDTPAASQPINLCVNNAATVSPTSVQLGANGQATATISDANVESVNVTACPAAVPCASPTLDCQSAKVAFGPVVQDLALSLGGSSALVGTPIPLTVAGFSDSSGQTPATGSVVTLCPSSNDLALSASSVTLDATGFATATATASAASASYQVAACPFPTPCSAAAFAGSAQSQWSGSPATSTACVVQSFASFAVASTELSVALNAQSAPVGAPVSVTVQGLSGGAPAAAGTTVFLCTSGSAAAGSAAEATPSITQLNAGGIATATLTDTTIESVAVSACLTQADCTLAFGATPPADCAPPPSVSFNAPIQSLSIGTSSVTEVVGTPLSITVQGFFSAAGESPAAGSPISLCTSDPSGQLSSPQATLDASGAATVTLTAEGLPNGGGPLFVTACASAICTSEPSAPTSATWSAGSPLCVAQELFVSPPPAIESIAVDALATDATVGQPIEIAVQGGTPAGNPAAGSTMEFCASSTTAVLSATTAVLDASGQAQVTVTDPVAESITVTACPYPSACVGGPGSTCPSTGVLQFMPGPPAIQDLSMGVSGTPAVSQPLTVTLLGYSDPGGSTAASGAATNLCVVQGTATLSNTVAQLDAAGDATFTVTPTATGAVTVAACASPIDCASVAVSTPSLAAWSAGGSGLCVASTITVP